MLSEPIPADGEALPLALARQAIEEQIERLIAMLDLLDGDENLEPYLAGTYPYAEDLEADPAEWGVADMEGAEEQFPGMYGWKVQ